MFTPAILHGSQFELSNMFVNIVEEEWMPSVSYEALARDAWQKQVGEAIRNAQTIWDGKYYRVSNIADMKGALAPPRFYLGTIFYRYIATYRALHKHHAREGLDPLNHLSTAGLIRTRDGLFLFGRRSRNGTIDLIGGGVQSDESAVESGSDIEANLRKEIFEELGIRSAQIQDVRGIGVLLSTTSNVLVIAAVDLDLSIKEVAAQFANRTDDDMSDLVGVNEDDLSAFLRNMPDYRTLISELQWKPSS